MTTGTFRWPLRNHWKLPKGEYCDFHGVNYYTRSTVTGFADGVRKNSPRNDLGWEIYPEGIVRCAQKLEKLLRRPIWVTENGTTTKLVFSGDIGNQNQPLIKDPTYLTDAQKMANRVSVGRDKVGHIPNNA